jgi:RND superfamily putative drug exporter
MKLLGDRNWYLPRWPNWLPKLEHSGTPQAPAATAIPATAV